MDYKPNLSVWCQRLVGGFLALTTLVMGTPLAALAADLHTESTSLTNPTTSQTSVTYTITQSNVTLSAIKCITVRFATTSGGTTKPTGMDITSATFSGTSNYVPTPASWTISNNNTTGVSSITFATGETPASASSRTIVLGGITNSSAVGTYFVDVNTFNNTDCTSSSVDINGKSAFAIDQGVTVSALVNPTLTFTVDSTTCNLGTLTSSTTGSCSHTMTAATNGTNGYTISYIATSTLTSGASDTISAIGGTATTSTTGSEQFGINLVDNATPNVGANASGGVGAASANYNTADNFAFNTSGAQVASSGGAPSALTTFTVSYIANISSTTEAGAYTATQTYNITANY